MITICKQFVKFRFISSFSTDDDDCGQDISLSDQKKAVYDSNHDSKTWNRKNHAGIHEFEDEIPVSSTSIDQSFQQAGSCRKIYFNDIRNTLSENEDADETSTFETRIRSSRRTALGQRDQFDIDGLASNGRKGFSKINQVIEESQGEIMLINFTKNQILNQLFHYL